MRFAHTQAGVGAAVLVFIAVAGWLWLAPSPKGDLGAPPADAAFGASPAPGFFTATDTPPAEAPAETASSAPVEPPRGWKPFANSTYGFSLYYPGDLTTKTYDEGGGASTFIFQDPASAQGFQVFVVPYGKTQVTKDRFLRDEPSGVMQDPAPLSIDGALATMFFGKDTVLGPMREIWFIRGGYLFEVSAPKSLDDWLGTIMQTWRFPS